METLQSFFTQLFTELNNEDSLAILFFLLVSFLIGLLFGWWSGRSKAGRYKKALKQKEAELISLQAEYKGLQEQFEMSSEDLKNANLELEDLKNKLAYSEEDKVKLQGDLYAANDQLDNLKKENLSNLTRIEELNSQISGFTSSGGEVAIDTETVNQINEVQGNFNAAMSRLTAVEEKLMKLENENSGLRTEISSLKDSSAVTFVDVSPSDDDEEIEVEETSLEKSTRAKQALNAAFGKRIKVATAEEKNDLKKINGVGPFIENKLNEIGIFTFEQISQFDDEIVQQVTDAIQFFPGRIQRDNWVGQAKTLFKK